MLLNAEEGREEQEEKLLCVVCVKNEFEASLGWLHKISGIITKKKKKKEREGGGVSSSASVMLT